MTFPRNETKWIYPSKVFLFLFTLFFTREYSSTSCHMKYIIKQIILQLIIYYKLSFTLLLMQLLLYFCHIFVLVFFFWVQNVIDRPRKKTVSFSFYWNNRKMQVCHFNAMCTMYRSHKMWQFLEILQLSSLLALLWLSFQLHNIVYCILMIRAICKYVNI